MPHLQGPQILSVAHVKRAGLEKEKGGSIIISLARSLTSGTYKKEPKEAVRARCYRNVRRFILRKRCLHFHCCCCCCAYAKPSAYAQKCVRKRGREKSCCCVWFFHPFRCFQRRERERERKKSFGERKRERKKISQF